MEGGCLQETGIDITVVKDCFHFERLFVSLPAAACVG